jgi:hypothetical protein
MIRVFIGYEPRQPLAYTVCQSSILRRASVPVAITPLVLKTLPLTRKGLTEFTFSRFLVPHLCGYEGMAVFLDADIIVLDDIAKLVAAADPNAPISVVKNVRQFEWPSVMVFNNALCSALTPEFVQTGDPFGIFEGNVIGALPPEWNHLVGYDKPQDAKLIHYTQGIPCWPETQGCEYAAQWHEEAKAANATVPYAELMGKSVHNKHVQERLKAA